MNHRALREDVCRLNRDLVAAGLAAFTWGNASALDRSAGVMAIKPSGVEFGALRPEDIALVSLATGEVIEGGLRPSSDTPTHLHLYRRFPTVGGIVHTHSPHATSWAQAGAAIPCLGTTHADTFHGPIPVTRPLSREEIATDYEHHTGVAIVDTFVGARIDPEAVPACLVRSHGAFAWGRTPQEALENARALEDVARTALETLRIRPDTPPLDPALRDCHFFRKHGAGATYGQKPPKKLGNR